MKRSKRLTRTTGLPRAGGFSRGTGFSRAAEIPRPVRKRKPARDTGPSRKIRALVLERDGYSCICCGRSVVGYPYSIQHRKRRSQGGDNSPSNLITVLGTGTTGCHERIDSRREPGDEARGYTVRSWDDTLLVPVTVFSPHGPGLALWLSDDGRYLTDPPEDVAA